MSGRVAASSCHINYLQIRLEAAAELARARNIDFVIEGRSLPPGRPCRVAGP